MEKMSVSKSSNRNNKDLVLAKPYKKLYYFEAMRDSFKILIPQNLYYIYQNKRFNFSQFLPFIYL